LLYWLVFSLVFGFQAMRSVNEKNNDRKHKQKLLWEYEFCMDNFRVSLNAIVAFEYLAIIADYACGNWASSGVSALKIMDFGLAAQADETHVCQTVNLRRVAPESYVYAIYVLAYAYYGMAVMPMLREIVYYLPCVRLFEIPAVVIVLQLINYYQRVGRGGVIEERANALYVRRLFETDIFDIFDIRIIQGANVQQLQAFYVREYVHAAAERRYQMLLHSIKRFSSTGNAFN
jgi:hypothetical protein